MVHIAVVSVGLEILSYLVREDGGALEVCVVVIPETCPSSQPFFISLSTIADSAGINVDVLAFKVGDLTCHNNYVSRF